jgi:hypothetical protein
MTLLARLLLLGLAALPLAAPGGDAILEPGLEGGEVEDALAASGAGRHLLTLAYPVVLLYGQTPSSMPFPIQSWDRPPPAPVPSSDRVRFFRFGNGG